jgi:undecaprenyl-diphosphatase
VVAREPFGTVDSRLAWYVGFGTVPIGIFGLAFKGYVETTLRSLYVISATLIVLALLLLLAEKLAAHRRTISELTLRDALFVGAWQALALIPGASRSGTTITGALFLGMKREDAARFSFLLAVPSTGLAGLFELKELLELDPSVRPSAAVLIVGTVVSFFAGMVAIAGLLRFLRTHTTLVFVAYRVGLGVLLLILLSVGWIHPEAGAEITPLVPPPPPPLEGS